MFTWLKKLLGRQTPRPVMVAEPLGAFERQDTARVIEKLVRGGFETPEDIAEIITEQYLDPDLLPDDGRQWIEREIARQVTAKRRQEEGWPAVTEWDRLDNVFTALEKKGVLALHQAGTTQSDGQSDSEEEWRDRGGPASGLDGYAVYHSQDVDRVLESRVLLIAFGELGDPPKVSAEVIAQRVVDTLKAAGFDARWTGEAGQRIEVHNLDWRKRGPS